MNKNINDEETKYKIVIILVVLSMAMALIICIGLKRNFYRYNVISLDGIEETADIEYSIDFVDIDNNIGNEYEDYYSITGWAGVKGKSTELFNTSIVLANVDGSINYELNTDMVVREDLDHFNDTDISYKNGGFITIVKVNDLKDGEYNVCIKIDDDICHFIETNKTIVIGD